MLSELRRVLRTGLLGPFGLLLISSSSNALNISLIFLFSFELVR